MDLGPFMLADIIGLCTRTHRKYMRCCLLGVTEAERGAGNFLKSLRKVGSRGSIVQNSVDRSIVNQGHRLTGFELSLLILLLADVWLIQRFVRKVTARCRLSGG